MKKGIKTTILALIGIIFLTTVYLTATVIKARLDTPGIARKALHASNITLQAHQLSKWQLHALLAVEDPNFYHHNGVDLKTPGAGITTITQSLVKIYYFDHFKPGIAKLKQTLIARYALNPLVSKDDQLTLFINNIYLGNVSGKAIYGFNTAARAYYHKPVSRLSAVEYLSIVALIVAPQNFSILKHPAANAERTRRIKRVVAGEYKPKELMDIYYGKLDPEIQKDLPPASYYPSIYERK